MYMYIYLHTVNTNSWRLNMYVKIYMSSYLYMCQKNSWNVNVTNKSDPWRSFHVTVFHLKRTSHTSPSWTQSEPGNKSRPYCPWNNGWLIWIIIIGLWNKSPHNWPVFHPQTEPPKQPAVFSLFIQFLGIQAMIQKSNPSNLFKAKMPPLKHHQTRWIPILFSAS